MTLKVNDRVVVVESIYPVQELSKGQTGVIVQTMCDMMFSVKMDNGYNYPYDDIGAWVFTQDELQLV